MLEKTKYVMKEFGNLVLILLGTWGVILIVIALVFIIVKATYEPTEEPRTPEYAKINETCTLLGLTHYDNETCIECIEKTTTYYNTNNRRYKHDIQKKQRYYSYV